MEQKTQNPSDSMQALIPTKNMPALLSYYFGVFGLIPFLGLPLTIAAIVLGIIGLHTYKRNPTPGAKVHAIIGLSLAVFQLLVFAIFMTLVVLGY